LARAKGGESAWSRAAANEGRLVPSERNSPVAR
jgi:hypothetical protein